MTQKFYTKKELSDNLQQALDKVTDYLSRRDHSERELKTKMARRFIPSVVDKAIEEAKERGWLKAPAELSEMVARQLYNRGKGPLYINGYLRKKGLPPIKTDAEELRARAQELLESKFPNWGEMNYKERQKPMNFLVRRGFPESLVLDLIRHT